MSNEDLLTVAEDIEYLTVHWEGTAPVSEPEIRRGSCILRRLLVERQIGEAWRAVGFNGEPRIFAVNLDALLGDHDRSAEAIPIAIAGGAKVEGKIFAVFCLSLPPLPKPRLAPGQTSDDLMRFPFRLSAYLESLSALVEGHEIKRREVIKYMANVRGGVHLQGRRASSDQRLIRELRKFETAVNVHVLGGLFFELLAIGQALAKSPDSQRILAAVRS